jgi:hypothetical protein
MAAQELPSFRRKLIRANEHLESIREALVRCAYGDCEIVPEQDADTNIGLLRLRLPKPPGCLSPLIGDFLFNARASLDHLVWQLVESTPARKHTVKNMFPICSTPEAFADQVRRHRLDGVPEKAPAIVETLQPYFGRNNPLRRMADLHELDKHRMLSLVTAVAKDTAVEWSRGNEVLISMLIGDEELRDGAVFGGLGIDLNHPDYPNLASRFSNVKVQGQAAIFVAFEDEAAEELEPLRVDMVLQEISEFLGETVFPSFRPFFH